VPQTQILSVVLPLGPRNADPAGLITQWHSAVSRIGTELELVVVANGLLPTAVDGLRALSASLSNLQVYVLQAPVSSQLALFAGLEHALGDWVAIARPESDPPDVIADLFHGAIRDGTDLVIAVDRDPPMDRMPTVRILSWIFHRLFRAFHGFDLSQAAPSARLFSRTVVNAILQHDYPLVALDVLPATGGYRCTIVPYHRKQISTPDALLDLARERWRTLIGINAVPLRAANGLCALGALAAMLYSLYAALTYLFKENVVPGWTTLSLLMSGMFFLMSLVLWFLSEYMILLLDAGARRARYGIAEEFASNIQTRRQRLNVESEE